MMTTSVCGAVSACVPIRSSTRRSAMLTADCLICISSSVSGKKLPESFFRHHSPKIINGEFKPNISSIFKKRKLIAFCGIGRPEKFFSMLRQLNLEIIKEYSFPDHHFYSKGQLTKILDVAEKSNALVVTTEKDFVKIPTKYKKIIYPLDIQLHLSENKKLLLELKNLVC